MILIAALAAAVGAASYAFTATNTVPDTHAGVGSGTISGFTITNVAYTMNAADGDKLDQVAFTIDSNTANVKIRLTAAGTWYACTNSSGSVTCDTTSPQATVTAADELTVAAAD